MIGTNFGSLTLCIPNKDQCEVMVGRNKAELLSEAMPDIDAWLADPTYFD